MFKDDRNRGKVLLITMYRKMFRVPENLDHYSPEDFNNAERKFIKMAIKTGKYHIKPNHRASWAVL